ncbi:ATP-binding response regulator [Paragemmobacter ruber]|uniref:histidine kinase n=1 Tax=Paragemmobacter ruber TaxID=1985673 RepID=A0ABW9Y7G2_9RHOB|nr:ATP-binding protein [Rhodobacter ruber]NBE08337.1 response regulator [Rhodobacter ruber]
MTTSVDIRILVAVACILLFFSACLATFLRGAWTERFRQAASLYAASLGALLIAAMGVFLSRDAPFVVSAALIIAGAHFSIVLAYLSLYGSLRPHPAAGLVVLIAGLICLAQCVLAVLYRDAPLLIITTSVVNAVVGLLAAGSLWAAVARTSPRNRLLVAAPFFMVSAAYAMRLVVLASTDPGAWFVVASSLIAFVLAGTSLYIGFALIILRESALSDALRQARAESDAILQQRTRLFSQINHELRTPLNGIVGLTRVLARHVADEDGKRTLRDLQSSAALLKTVVDDVLDFAKLDNGALELEHLPFNLAEVAEAMATQYRALASERGVALRLELAPDMPPWRRGDAMRLRQILHNLLANAVKFTSAGEIVLSVAPSGEEGVRLAVADTGIGMSAEQLAHLFEPFRQATAGTARQFGGTGLGLSIVNMLVTAMGGRIAVDSAPGSGTRMEVTLPLPATEAPPVTQSEPPQPAPRAGAGLRLLCADDDEINRMVLEALLIELGVTPVMADGGPDMIEKARAQRFDAYLIDINMPGMNGVETLAALRRAAAEEGRVPPIAVAATANVMAEDIRAYLDAGFDAHLPKPIVFDDLAKLLQRVRATRTETGGDRAAEWAAEWAAD